MLKNAVPQGVEIAIMEIFHICTKTTCLHLAIDMTVLKNGVP
jgi:hypothetical protein